ncbi:DUF6246 family protein [Biostraticola tofi]|uniref:Uncharacterized protein n=1 Tax=Biostraticola tofi TaxID=466109 RepID=A0A4R3Z581_9GAMM|nr:DUF6246 family protein [Biostraticola tofi]TCW00387.1 hypothetical protein EDC52_101737 [Biostraticola tofi]
MTPLTEIGEMLISDTKRDYFIRPSFANMSRIGSPGDIVQAYSILNGAEVTQIISAAMGAYRSIPEWLIKALNKPAFGRKVLSTSMLVMQSCCDEDITSLIGEWRPGHSGIVYRSGQMPMADIIILAKSLLDHGIIGQAKVRKLQRHETNDYVSEFRAFDYISAARNHFSMPRIEAEQLTMTEFQLLLSAKYPDQKGFTREEYDASTDEHFRKKAARIAKAEAR